ncbi:Flavin-dependent oxidoreductase, luciferase family (includes alkanesulfonate monooxygenase SsuD and methylene tetrahydromethanopterin reductase) [Saccharopolyspora antimicrobica]|uniref:Alkanesulfonate monooxygenase SsuD/methylene tetrahydromethanopterin reductase-like flavin-dependent oxidoreductase (Luciferase family) n=1 Tax=Saccharopolyspora antimicrobica TaxID=455193 RepID=A0A1I4SCP7_9PSEU|nr:LLM class flavin-dependent oxidoreductase [Saccharopolyspora antimicrobica]RKT87691.1 alkanesulfonate monooxygenase SsuD/methylene tetrahydromethanopterin reductase-like flavin-dependent oxidoreductase (luciferase family) [Saccharopolyspora antimicrobica]SFM62286.1 Flavin-dependent oxidoreductase, luciferase family (includes alkanesulfonate monooxygenase SsuD and methylene tetrahydromethanopterin reductase) [Saccharopolyspora antimicrobica]
MKIGLGLPIAEPTALPTWARLADDGPFSTLGLLDRLVYDNPEPLVTLATLAGATRRIRLQTEVLLAPLRQTPLLAKQAATLAQLSGNRFTLGIGVGGREDDHAAAGTDLKRRGRILDEQMDLMHRLWSGEPHSDSAGPIGPAVRPEVLFGGFRPAAIDRVGRWGDGFLAAGPLEYMATTFALARNAWQQHGRPGEPRLIGQLNTAIGPDAVADEARAEMIRYYGDANFANAMVTTPAVLRNQLARLESLGADEAILYCWSPDPDQVNHLADLLP